MEQVAAQRIVTILTIAAAMIFPGCLGPGTLNEQQCSADGPSLFAAKCMICHSAALMGDDRSGAPEGANFDTEEDIQRQILKIREMAIDKDLMPPTRALPDCDQRLLGAYLIAVEPMDCVPACSGRACGDDGCGGSCGSCSAAQSCGAGQCAWLAKDFSADVYPIFQGAGCGGSQCHGGQSPKQGLDLSSAATAYLELVNVDSEQCSGKIRVVPNDINASYLVNKLTGSGMCSGSQMPKVGQPLTATQIDIIQAWIATGAPFQTPRD